MSLVSYLKETAAEVKHISWPSTKQAIIYTILIIVFSAFVAVYLGVFDAIFSRIINFLVK
jgi:preprotein translocase subunit SecE